MENIDTVTLISEEFENDSTGENVQGVTVIIDGKLKDVLDIIMSKRSEYSTYVEIIRDSLFEGLNCITSQIKHK
jgi:hypothetical protein